MATDKKAKTPTFKANGETYNLHFGMAAMIAVEKELGVPLAELGEVLKSPKMATVRDLFAASLIQHHPVHNATSAVLSNFLGTMGDARRPVDWPGQQSLANELLDVIGVTTAADLISAAVEASPHMSEAAPA